MLPLGVIPRIEAVHGMDGSFGQTHHQNRRAFLARIPPHNAKENGVDRLHISLGVWRHPDQKVSVEDSLR